MMSFTFFFYIFLLLNVVLDGFSYENSYYKNSNDIFQDSINYFIISFVVVSSLVCNYLAELISDHLFNIGSEVFKNPKFKEGFIF